MEETLELLEDALVELESAHETIKNLFDKLNEKCPQYRINKQLKIIKHKEKRIIEIDKQIMYFKNSEIQTEDSSDIIDFLSGEKYRLIQDLEQTKEELKLLQNN